MAVRRAVSAIPEPEPGREILSGTALSAFLPRPLAYPGGCTMKRWPLIHGFVVACVVLTSACAELVRGGNHYVLDEDSDEGAGQDPGGSSGDGKPLSCDSGFTACNKSCVELGSDASN